MFHYLWTEASYPLSGTLNSLRVSSNLISIPYDHLNCSLQDVAFLYIKSVWLILPSSLAGRNIFGNSTEYFSLIEWQAQGHLWCQMISDKQTGKILEIKVFSTISIAQNLSKSFSLNFFFHFFSTSTQCCRWIHYCRTIF